MNDEKYVAISNKHTQLVRTQVLLTQLSTTINACENYNERAERLGISYDKHTYTPISKRTAEVHRTLTGVLATLQGSIKHGTDGYGNAKFRLPTEEETLNAIDTIEKYIPIVQEIVADLNTATMPTVKAVLAAEAEKTAESSTEISS